MGIGHLLSVSVFRGVRTNKSNRRRRVVCYATAVVESTRIIVVDVPPDRNIFVGNGSVRACGNDFKGNGASVAEGAANILEH